MGFKKYIVFSVIFIAAVYGYVFSLELGDYRFSIMDISINLPVAVWFVVPVLLLFIATILHILFYGLVNVFKTRAINKDKENMISFVKSNLLGNKSKSKFRTKSFKSINNILSQFNISVKDEVFTSDDQELNQVVANIQEVQKGKFVSDKSFKPNTTSTLSSLNLLNKINAQVDFAVDVIKKSENYPTDVVRHAFDKVLDEKSMTTVKKLYKNVTFDKQLANKLLQKDIQNNEFGFSSDEVLNIVKNISFTKQEFISLASEYKEVLQPDEHIALFETLSNEIENAKPAYYNTLLEYEMIDKLKEILSSTEENEYKIFKAILDLKDAGKQYSLEDILY